MDANETLNEHSLTSANPNELRGAKIDAEILQAMMIAFDAIFIFCVGVLADRIVDIRVDLFGECSILALNSTLIFLIIFALRKGYNINALLSPRRQLVQVIFAWFITFFIIAWIAFLLKITGEFSRIGVLFFFNTTIIGLSVFHVFYSKFLQARVNVGQLHLQHAFAVIVGDASEFDHLRQQMMGAGIAFVGSHIIAPNTKTFNLDCLNLSNRIRTTLRQTKCDAVLVFVPWENRRRIEELLETIRPFPTPAILMADRTANRIVLQKHMQFGALNGFEVQCAPLSRFDRMMKRVFDISIAVIGIGVLSPLMGFAALAILVESGRPVLFRQARKGFGGRVFRILKFRSMTVQENGSTVAQARRHDRRVTRVGRILRRTSIDELPQLFNVLRGEMSIVGPRPHALAHDNQYDDLIGAYAYRHHVKPGITGWAQIKGHRGETRALADMEARVQHDLWYINHWSIWLDFRIVVGTAASVLFDKNAY